MSEHKKYGLLGRKLGHSLSPRIHELIFKYTGFPASTGSIPWSRMKVKSFITGLAKGSGFHGLNVTIPYKSDVMPYLGFISEEARKIGSVNTILPTEKAASKATTPTISAWKRCLDMAGIEPGGKKVPWCWARAVRQGRWSALLKDRGCRDILLVSRDKERAQG